jgi:hypothetical protein
LGSWEQQLLFAGHRLPIFIRGWLTSINNAKLDNDGVLNDDDNDAFGEELTYNNSFPAGNTTTGTNQWNGNISGVKWKT